MRLWERSNPMSNVVWISSACGSRQAAATWRVRLMADRTFEMELDRLFGEHAAFADADLFAHRVEASLERGWTFRRLLIGGLGLAGGLFGAAQLLGSGMMQRLSALGAQYAPNVQVKWTDVALA